MAMDLHKSDPLADLMALEVEQDKRDQEALKCYRPARQLPFHKSHAPELILSGGKRSGKTLGVACEFAARVLGIPITAPNGRRIKSPWPVSTKSDPRLYWVIGWDVDHIGQTIFRKLFEPGTLFRVIKDKETGVWRTFNPADDDDASRISDSRPAQPLIPERLIDTSKGVNGFVWENAGAKNFSQVFLKNGATICAYPSSSKHAKQGDAVDGIWIDEDIQIPGHLREWQDRLTDRNGWFMWSVWPHTRNNALIDLIDRADACRGEKHPSAAHYQLIMSENPYIPNLNKQLALGRMGSDEEIARRDRGDLLMDTLSMYDYYPGIHLIRHGSELPRNVKPQDPLELLSKMYSERGCFPRDWTRYLAIDPSHTRTAVAFGVVPPQEYDGMRMGDILIIENELIVTKHSAAMLAEKVKPMVQGYQYEAFIMDQQIGRQTRVGADKTVFQIYAEAFGNACIESRTTRNSFALGCNMPQVRYSCMRDMLAIGACGVPSLLLVEGKTWVTQKEFNTYRKKQLNVGGIETVLDEPSNPRKHDAMAAAEYLCAYVHPLFKQGTAFIDPSLYPGSGSAAFRKAMSIKKKQKAAEYGEDGYSYSTPGALALF